MCAALLWFYTAHNRFPYFYHTDEPGKVRQVIDGTRNFHHPLLMIAATDLALRVLHLERTPQNVAIVGRWFSAVASVLAIAGLVVLASRHFGPGLGLLAGALAGLHPVLFQSAHWMKEDCGLLAGIVWTFVALDSFSRRQSRAAIVFAGVACGVAVSAKYLGLLVLLPAFALIIIEERPRGWQAVVKSIVLLLGSALLAFALINSQALFHPASALGGAATEFEHMAQSGRPGLFQTNYLPKLVRRAGAPMLIAVVVYVGGLIARRERKPFEWVMLSFWALFLFVLSFTPLSKDRYLLPVLTFFCFMAVASFRFAIGSLAGRGKFLQGAVVFLCLAAVAAPWLPLIWRSQREFGSDSRKEMIAWIRTNLPGDAVIAHDSRIWPEHDDTLAADFSVPQKRIAAQHFLSEFKSIEQLRRAGATHAVVTGKFYRDLIEGAEVVPVRADQNFYFELAKRSTSLWRAQRGAILYLHPGLDVYELPR